MFANTLEIKKRVHIIIQYTTEVSSYKKIKKTEKNRHYNKNLSLFLFLNISLSISVKKNNKQRSSRKLPKRKSICWNMWSSWFIQSNYLNPSRVGIIARKNVKWSFDGFPVSCIIFINDVIKNDCHTNPSIFALRNYFQP